MNKEEMLRFIQRHTLEAILQVMSRSKLSQRAKTIEKKCSTSEEYLGQTNFLRRSVP